MDALEQLSEKDPREREAALRARIENAVITLSGQLAEGHTDHFQRLLQFYSRFWSYSVRNCLLIQMQCPEATRCAGAVAWYRLGYHVREDEKPIWIWAPITHKHEDPDTGKKFTTISGFRSVPVFDFSQLEEAEGRPFLAIVQSLPDDMEQELDRCVAKVRAAGIQVEFTRLNGATFGFSSRGKITIAENLDSRNQLFVLLHELVHELYHQQDLIPDPSRTRAQAEFEAESVAFVAAAVMGLEHPGARDYLLNWQATPESLHQSLIAIQMMVKRILVLLETPFDTPVTNEALAA